MADIPKPLPRTRIGAKPIRVLENSEISLSTELSPAENSLNHTRNQNINNDSVTVIQIEQESSSCKLNENNEKEYIEAENLLESIGDKAKAVIGKDDHSDLKSESTSSFTNKDDEENPFTAPNVSDTSSKEIEVVEDDDDNDDVIDEILRYKKITVSQKIILNNGKSDSSSSKHLEKNDLDSANAAAEDLLSIRIHRSDCLKMEHIIRHPSVMVHIVDSDKEGVYFEKSKPDKNVTYNQEHSSFILPVMTRPFNFKDNKCVIPEWEETLTFNETASYIIKPSTIFFFEIVDFVDSSHLDDEYATIGWHRIAWAFLKPLGSNNILNVGKTLRLQLYEACPKSSNVPSVSVPCVYQWYKKKRFRPYPSTLFVTVEKISYSNIDSKPQQRSCTPFQPEVGSDASVKSLAIFSSDGEEFPDLRDNSSAIYRLSDIEWSRLPGQSCKIPNSKISTLHPDSRGCLAAKFSNSGIFLACGTSNDVFIYAIDGVIEKRLNGHQGLIYTLCWFTDDSLLLSASADCTACIWDTKSSNLNPIQILPHPAFVYCSTFLYPERVIVTGSYDSMLRIWYQTHASSKVWQLHQELRGHEGFVNALCSYRNKEFFSGDSIGIIIHWGFDECERWGIINEIKLPEIQGAIINKLSLYPGDKRLLIHTRDSLLRTMDIKTAVTIQWYQGSLNDSFQCNSVVTPCGSLIFSTSEDGTVNVWESNTGKQVAFYSGNFASGCGGTVDFHPYDHIAVFSFYSSKNSSSSVYLLKYSANALNDIDIALYLLNESSRQSQKIDNLSASSVSGEENDSNCGKMTTEKKRFQRLRP